MKRLINYKWSLVVLVIFFGGLAVFMSLMPRDAEVPVHWNYRNEVDAYSGVWTALAMYAAIGLFVFLLFYLMPYYSPWYKRQEERNEKVMPALCLILLIFMAVQGLYAFYLAYRGIQQPTVQIVLIMIGLLFVFMGNLMPKVPKNFFVGIKTPWTLANEEVWRKTHRLGGLLFVLSGLILVIKAFIGQASPGVHLGITIFALALLLYPLLHSLILYKRLK